MNGHIRQRLGELLHTEMYRLLQLLYSTLSCIHEMNEHDMQRSVEFYKFNIPTKKTDQFLSALINIVLVYRMSHLGSISYVQIANKFVE